MPETEAVGASSVLMFMKDKCDINLVTATYLYVPTGNNITDGWPTHTYKIRIYN